MRCAWSITTLLTLGVLCACAEPEPDEPTASPQPIVREVSDGPLRMTVAADRDEILVGDAVRLTIEVIAPTHMIITMPEFDEGMGPFDVDARQTPPDLPVDDRRQWRHEYVLSTFESGDVELPGVELSYQSVSGADAAEPMTIATEPIPVRVASAIAANESAEALRDIQGAVDVPIERAGPWRWMIAGGLALLIVLAAILVLRRMMHRGDPMTALPPLPHIWALDRLRALREASLLDQREFQRFYSELSGIIRHYIERRFALRAPEQTTEEFLREARRSVALEAGHKVLLAGFLRAADMVKFARHEPASDEAEGALASAEQFVNETAPTMVEPERTSV